MDFYIELAVMKKKVLDWNDDHAEIDDYLSIILQKNGIKKFI
jgi:hypothetical protein